MLFADRISIIALGSSLWLAWPLFAQPAPARAPAAPPAYRIEARIDDVRREVKGTAEIAGPLAGAALGSLQFCLGTDQIGAAAITMEALTWRDGARETNLLGSARYTPSRHSRSQRILTVPVPGGPVNAEGVALNLRWTARLPRTRGVDLLGAEWYPQLVRADASASACDLFTAGQAAGVAPAEFDVTLTAPPGWIVAATGREIPTEGSAAAGAHRFRQASVAQFVWSISPRYIELTHHLVDVPGPPAGIDIRLLLQPEHAGQGSRLLDAAVETLAANSRAFVPYGDDHITIVDTPWQSGLGGRSYPRLITFETPWLRTSAVAGGEADIARGIGRQLWGGLVGVDPDDAAMLADGLAEYAQSVALERLVNRRRQRLAYSEYEASYFGGFVPWVFRDVLLARETAGVGRPAYLRVPHVNPDMPAGGRVAAESKALATKAALGLGTLERFLGWPTLQRALAVVAETYSSRQMSLADFARTVGEAVGQDLTWFFDGIFRRSEAFDFAVGALTSVADTGCGFDPCYRTTVIAERRGDALFTGTNQTPSGEFESGRALSVVVHFSDGQSVTEHWDGRAHAKTFVYQSRARAVSAHIDPSAVLLVDVNHVNNSRTLAPRSAEAATRWSAAWLTWLQNALLSWASLV